MGHIKRCALLLLITVSTTAIAGDYEDGVKYEKAGLNAKAALSFYSGARTGDARAIRELAWAYYQGRGVNENKETAERLMLFAAEHGDKDAQVFYGSMCLSKTGYTCAVDGSNADIGYSWFLIAGEDTVKKLGFDSEDMTRAMNEHLEYESALLNIDARLAGKKRADAWKASHESPASGAASGVPASTSSELSPEDITQLDSLVDTTDMKARVKQDEEALAAKEEQQRHADDLRSGRVKISNIKDAWIAQGQISDLMELMASPMLKPNHAIYGARITLDAEERKGVVRAKWDLDSTESILASPLQELSQGTVAQGAARISNIRMKYGGSVYYAQLNQSKKTIVMSDNLRMGQAVWVIGRYVGNRKFKRANGTQGTMPVLEVLYLSE